MKFYCIVSDTDKCGVRVWYVCGLYVVWRVWYVCGVYVVCVCFVCDVCGVGRN